MKALWLLILLTSSCLGQTARQYYEELHKAGGLDRMADKYVCFDDDKSLDALFIFSEGKDLREFMIADGTMKKMPKDYQERLKKDFLIFRGYDKGVAHDNEEFYEPSGNSWLSDKRILDNKTKAMMRLRFSINWDTLRYKRTLELLNADSSYNKEVARYGRCEKVALDVAQHGNP